MNLLGAIAPTPMRIAERLPGVVFDRGFSSADWKTLMPGWLFKFENRQSETAIGFWVELLGGAALQRCDMTSIKICWASAPEVTSAAEAAADKQALIAALKRCATPTRLRSLEIGNRQSAIL